jgi:hypothetical protein
VLGEQDASSPFLRAQPDPSAKPTAQSRAMMLPLSSTMKIG